MNIYEKLMCITKEIKVVAKNLEVGVGQSKYNAVAEGDVLSAVKELEAKYRIYSYPCKREVIDSAILSTKKEYNGKVTEGNQIFLRIDTTYRFVNVDEPSEYVDITSYGDGIDTQDKSVGKAMTYADKYALLKAYKIITGEDTDMEHSPDVAKYEKVDAVKKASQKQLEIIKKKYTGDNLDKLLKTNGIDKVEDLPMTKASDLISALMKKEKKDGEEKQND